MGDSDGCGWPPSLAAPWQSWPSQSRRLPPTWLDGGSSMHAPPMLTSPVLPSDMHSCDPSLWPPVFSQSLQCRTSHSCRGCDTTPWPASPSLGGPSFWSAWSGPEGVVSRPEGNLHAKPPSDPSDILTDPFCVGEYHWPVGVCSPLPVAVQGYIMTSVHTIASSSPWRRLEHLTKTLARQTYFTLELESPTISHDRASEEALV